MAWCARILMSSSTKPVHCVRRKTITVSEKERSEVSAVLHAKWLPSGRREQDFLGRNVILFFVTNSIHVFCRFAPWAIWGVQWHWFGAVQAPVWAGSGPAGCPGECRRLLGRAPANSWNCLLGVNAALLQKVSPTPYLEICLIWAVPSGLPSVESLFLGSRVSPACTLHMLTKAFLGYAFAGLGQEIIHFKEEKRKELPLNTDAGRRVLSVFSFYFLALSHLLKSPHLVQPGCWGINLLAGLIQTSAECMFLLFCLELAAGANTNSSGVGTNTGYLSQAVLGGLSFLQ